MDVVGLYPNIPHGEGLASLYKFLETRENKQISSDTLTELAEIVLKNNIFEFDEKTFKQKCGTTIGMKLVPSYAVLFILFSLILLNYFHTKMWNPYWNEVCAFLCCSFYG